MSIERTSNPGLFISCEGLDGAGKSTSMKFVIEALKENGFDVVQTREPGGTELGEQLRSLLLHQDMTPITEVLLMFAARAEHIDKVIRPALEAGKCVVCDRFEDSTYAYQGAGKGLGKETIDPLADLVLGTGASRIEPQYTWFFDVTPELARKRLEATRDMDRFEREEEEFFIRVRQAYSDRAQANRKRYKVIDSSLSLERIEAKIHNQVRALAEDYHQAHARRPKNV